MNPILQLRWMIAMLETQPQHTHNADVNNRTDRLLTDMHNELAVLQRHQDEAIAAGKIMRAKDAEK